MKRRERLFLVVLAWLQTNSGACERHADQVVQCLLSEWTDLSSDTLSAGLNVVLTSTRQSCVSVSSSDDPETPSHPKLYEFLPKLLQQLAYTESRLRIQGMDGSAYKEWYIERLCSSRWAAYSVLPLAAAFREVSFSDGRQFTRVIEKLVAYLDMMAEMGVVSSVCVCGV